MGDDTAKLKVVLDEEINKRMIRLTEEILSAGQQRNRWINTYMKSSHTNSVTG